MLSLNKGEPIARIKGGKHDGKYIRIQKHNYDVPLNQQKQKPENNDERDFDFDLYDIENKLLKGKELSKNELKHLRTVLNKSSTDEDNSIFGENGDKKEIIIDDGMIEPIAHKKTTRMWICAPSDSGKSVYVGKLINDYKRVHPNGKTYLFSDVGEDEEIDKYKPIRVILDRRLVEEPILPDELSNGENGTLVIFDDIDSCSDKKVQKAMQELRDTLYNRGRHENITVISTNHLLCNGIDTKIALNSSQFLTLFPHAGILSDYFMNNYTGLDKKNIARVKKLPSRWVTIHKNNPQYVMYSGGVYLLKNE